MTHLPKTIWEGAFSYRAYRDLIGSLLAKDRTTGDNHSQAMLHYTRMSTVRMKRLDKTIRLLPEVEEALQSATKPLRWLVLTEAWCGDAGQSIPVMAAMAAQHPAMDFRLILRDEHPDIMDAFRTNGGRSIPKLLLMDSDSLKVLATWGPRPEELQCKVQQDRATLATLTDEDARRDFLQQAIIEAQKWYTKDKTQSIQRELLREVQKAQALAEDMIRPASSNR